MIDWWGPIIHEFYGATEGHGFTACDTAEWLAHPGTVGKVIMGDLHILDDEMQPSPPARRARYRSRPRRSSNILMTPNARRRPSQLTAV